MPVPVSKVGGMMPVPLNNGETKELTGINDFRTFKKNLEKFSPLKKGG